MQKNVALTQTEFAAQKLGNTLLTHKMLLACAESCTGGLIGAAVTAINGSSQWFERGYITYSNAAKEQDLHVHSETLEQFGAVSEETAMAMAIGVLAKCPEAHIALSTTGIAGPTGDTPGKPIGMVCFGFARREGDGIVAHAQTEVFSGSRQEVREAATLFALEHAVELVTANVPH